MMYFPEQYRAEHPLPDMVPKGREGGYFKIPWRGWLITCLAINGPEWEHVAVTVCEPGKRPNRCPTWKEMCFVRGEFWDSEDAVMQIHPPENEYVNNHEFCLHLWRPVNVQIPLPPSEMVGVKT